MHISSEYTYELPTHTFFIDNKLSSYFVQYYFNYFSLLYRKNHINVTTNIVKKTFYLNEKENEINNSEYTYFFNIHLITSFR